VPDTAGDPVCVLAIGRSTRRNRKRTGIAERSGPYFLQSRIGDRTVRLLSSFSLATYSVLEKGGDPAAGSPTATLLRLRPSHRACLRPLPPLRVGRRTSGAPNFHGVTGGVYKARERIHRGVADPRLLAI